VGEVCAVNSGHGARYDPAYFDQLFRIEDRHFWFHTRNRILAALVAQIASSFPEGGKVLEIGCGNGNVLRHLQRACDGHLVVGMDAFEEGLQIARRRNCPRLVQGDATQHPFRSQFDLVGLFDVLEHVPEDERLLEQIRRILRPAGVLLLTVPARQSLWSYFDEASGHCRRYELDGLRGKLQQTGYQLEYITPYMLTLLPLMWLGRRVAGLTSSLRRDSSPTGMALREMRLTPGVNGLLRFLLAREIPRIVERRGLPFGTSLLAVARAGDQAPGSAAAS
jgi:SAM-dependent methyltransferase